MPNALIKSSSLSSWGWDGGGRLNRANLMSIGIIKLATHLKPAFKLRKIWARLPISLTTRLSQTKIKCFISCKYPVTDMVALSLIKLEIKCNQIICVHPSRVRREHEVAALNRVFRYVFLNR